MRERCLMIVAGLAMAGCSPYVYGPEIKEFGGSTAKLSASVTAAEAENHLLYRRSQEARLLPRLGGYDRSALVALSLDPACAFTQESGAAVPLAPCRVLVSTRLRGASQDTQPLPVDPERAAFARARNATEALTRYVAALQAITDADDRQELDAAARSFCGTVAAVASTVGTLGGPAIALGPIIGATCNLVALAYGVLLDRQRHDVLQEAVLQAQERVVPDLARLVGETLEQARSVRITRLAAQGEREADLLPLLARGSRVPGSDLFMPSPEFTTRYERLLQTPARITALRAAQPRDVAERLVAAHAALSAALQSRSRQAGPLFAALDAFAQEAEALSKALQPIAD